VSIRARVVRRPYEPITGSGKELHMSTQTLLEADLDSPRSQRASHGDSRRITRHAPSVARFALGALFLIFGLNGFLNFIPAPAEGIPAGAMAFGAALMKTGYMFPLIKGTEVLVGALLLANRYVALALVLIAPVIVNIVAFHAFLAPAGLGMALFVLGLELYLAWSQRAAYAPLWFARSPH
jgi:hypothetical protein